jgi:protein SCO1/2
MHFMKQIILLAAVLAVLTGCTRDASSPPVATATNQTHFVRGVVKAVAPNLRTATIHHQAIPGYMMEMTMDFPLQNTNELRGISPGDEITFTLVVDENDDWIQNIHRVGRVAEAMTNSGSMFHSMIPELKPGDRLPDYELLGEDGKHLHFSNFHGCALAFTFFFTRCPLPDYCPRMNKNFAETQKLLATNATTNWQLLCISFDPEFDQPEMLHNYACFYRGNSADRWWFAAAATNVLAELAPRLDLMIVHEGASISHNLRTVVLDTNGIIFRQFDGNDWTPQQLADAMVQAARPSTSQ